MNRALAEILLWTARCLTGALFLATLLPFVPSGSWMVRVWDFPRLQLTALCLITVVALLACTLQFGWTRGIRWYVLLLGLAAVWQLAHVVPFTSFWPKRLPDADNPEFKLLIANLAFDNPKAEEAAQIIQSLDVDAVLLMEVDHAWFQTLAPVRARFAYHIEEIRPEGLGMALWSNTPLEHPQVRYIVSDQRPSIHAELVLSPTSRVRFVGLHPAPPGLRTRDGDERYDSRIRDAELVKIAELVSDNTEQKWIIAGDFNDVAWSHTTRLFERISGLEDPRVGRGLFNTYHAKRPLLRYPLDHIFVSPSFGVADLQRILIPGSDHFGILVQLRCDPGRGADPEADPDDHEEADDLIEEGHEDAQEEGEGASDAEAPRGNRHAPIRDVAMRKLAPARAHPRPCAPNLLHRPAPAVS